MKLYFLNIRISFPRGEAQRVAIARAIAAAPKLLLMDEPFSHLDIELKQKMFEVMHDIRKNNDLTVIYVSHTKEELKVLADRIGYMKNGRINRFERIVNNE